MIQVSGRATLQVPYTVELDMTVEQYDAASEHTINQLIDNTVDWQAVGRNAQVTDIEVDEVEEAD